MITPADLARMLGQTPDSADSHTQDHLLYTSETPRHSADSGESADSGGTAETPAGRNADYVTDGARTAPAAARSTVDASPDTAVAPTPAPVIIPTPATVFGMHATVTIATLNETIEGQTDGIDSEAEAESISHTATAAPVPQPAPAVTSAAPVAPTPATVFGHRPATAPTAPPAPTGPTPAMMPQRRTSDGPTTFASLDAQELPVVREYSAGGLIFDDQNRVAIIARHSRSGHLEWCLPKGHIEKGETPRQTAVREVHEETGILGEVIDSIATIDYWFTGTTQRVHKLVHHFALRQTGGELTVEGDPDHEAEDAIWVRFDDLDDVLSYPNERKIAWLYARKKNRQANE